MRTRNIILLIASITLLAASGSATAQICRVNAGCKSNGCKSFKEVYEYDFVDVKPEFPGGGTSLVNFINETRHYPKEAYAKGVEGRVTCSFVVNADGTVSNISVIKGVEESLNAEALRILSKMPEWHPGKIGAQSVPVRVITCVPFRK